MSLTYKQAIHRAYLHGQEARRLNSGYQFNPYTVASSHELQAAWNRGFSGLPEAEAHHDHDD